MASYSRIRLEIEGIVQGVGFRPFIFRLACRHGVSGWVRNNSVGVVLEGESPAENLSAFVQAIALEAPPLARITSMRQSALPMQGERGFRILSSETGENRIQIAPDGDVCGDCLTELFDPADRRFRYPFINCTNCGPRFSIITGVPYDRPLTTMSSFAMCGECRAEYENPHDRRFHAQPVACPACGPRVRLLAADPSGMEPVADAVRRLRAGQIVAIKGIGGTRSLLPSWLPISPRSSCLPSATRWNSGCSAEPNDPSFCCGSEAIRLFRHWSLRPTATSA